ncbi:MAG: hypothetical protein HRF49_07700 [bacterium]|jgi:hypothetical protein
MNEYKPPPVISRYLRCPEDVRIARWWLEQQSEPVKALYIGPAYGEDFYSFLTIGFGLKNTIEWHAVELNREAFDSLDDPVIKFLGVQLFLADFEAHVCATPHRQYDLIIANYCWHAAWDGSKRRRLKALLDCNPGLLICRDAITQHYQTADKLEYHALVTAAGYRALRHVDQVDFKLDACKRRDTGYILMRTGAELPDDIYIELAPT